MRVSESQLLIPLIWHEQFDTKLLPGELQQLTALAPPMLHFSNPQWTQVRTSWNQVRFPLETSFGNLRVHLNNFPGFAQRISSQSSRTIRQTSLLGRRPAVRRKPLNPGAGHGARVLAGACRRPSVVTEGYRRCAPLPPTHPQTTPGQLKSL